MEFEIIEPSQVNPILLQLPKPNLFQNFTINILIIIIEMSLKYKLQNLILKYFQSFTYDVIKD